MTSKLGLGGIFLISDFRYWYPLFLTVVLIIPVLLPNASRFLANKLGVGAYSISKIKIADKVDCSSELEVDCICLLSMILSCGDPSDLCWMLNAPIISKIMLRPGLLAMDLN